MRTLAFHPRPQILKKNSHFQSTHHHFSFPEDRRITRLCNSECHRRPRSVSQPRAVREWKEYEEAVKRKDLAGALRLLKSIEGETQMDPVNGSASREPFRSGIGESGFIDWERDWDVLDACLNADDMKLVANTYGFLKDRGFLPNFGKCRNIVLEGSRDVTPSVLKSSTGLEVSKLSPKKWGLSGSSQLALLAFLGAYLMGCPIRGVILDPIVAMQMGIQGQAGTQFWDEKMANDLAEGRLDGSSFDRYCMVLFAGIAAEALVYGDAEGGENDENFFKSICVLLQPPLSVAQMSNQARWSVLQSFNLLKWYKRPHQAVVKALESGCSLSSVIRRMEEAILTNR